MAAPNLRDIKHIPGTMIWNPTDLDADSDTLGGTILGYSDEIYLLIFEDYEPFVSSIYGRNYSKIKVMETVFLGCLQKDLDADMLARVRGETTPIATSSGLPLITGQLQASGGLADARGGRLVVKPREPERHQGVIFYNAVGVIEKSARIHFEKKKDWGFPVLFESFPSTLGNTWKLGYLRDFGTADLS